jgi:hypothetical protein
MATKHEDIFKHDPPKKSPSAIGRFFKTLFQTFVPDNYHALCEKPFKEAGIYFLHIVLLSFGIIILLLLLNIASLRMAFQKEFDKVENLNVSVDFKLKAPIVFEKQGIVIANQKAYDEENLLITDYGIVRRPIACSFFAPACWFSKDTIKVNSTSYGDLAENKDRFAAMLISIILVALPVLIVAYLLFYAIKLLLLIVVATALGFALARLFGFMVSIRKALLVALFSSTIYAVLEPFDLVMWNLYYVHVVIFLGFYSVAMLIVAGKKHRYEENDD